MTMLATAGRIAGTVAAMAATRVELAAVELQEEARRLLGYLAWTVVAASLAAGAILLAALFVILLFWDSWRLQAVAAMAMLLGAAGVLLLLKVRHAVNAAPALLSATMAELRSDLAAMRQAAGGSGADANTDNDTRFTPGPAHE